LKHREPVSTCCWRSEEEGRAAEQHSSSTMIRVRRGFKSVASAAAVRRKGGLGVVLDIDGVLLRGKHVIKNAPEALGLLQKNKIPYVFLTNGGGMLEATKARDLTSKLGLKQAVLEEDVLLSHSPFKELASLYHDKRVLILGHKGCLEVAKSYGFRKVVTADQLHLETPSLYHREVRTSARQSEHAKEPVAAALIFHDPLHWALEIQVLTDLLRPKVPGGPQAIPLYACNPDLVYNTEHPLPRFTQGAFCEAFRVVYEQHTDEELLINYCGKVNGMSFYSHKWMNHSSHYKD